MATSRTPFAEFDPLSEEWVSYSERFDFYLLANGVDDATLQLATLLSSVGPATYKLIRSLCSPASPKDKTYKDIVKLLTDHYRPKPAIAVERFKFHSRTRKPSESVSAYLAQLRELSEFCEFGDNLEDMLRDKLICGINDPRIQKLLLSEKDLSFKRAQELAEFAEAADRNIQDVRKTQPLPIQPTVNVVSRNKPSRGKQPSIAVASTCYRCGGPDPHIHYRFKDAVCHYCKKKGHISKVCVVIWLTL